MNYEEAMEYIKSTYKFGSNYGTERTKKILEILGNPQDKIKCIHIAGTNGKGSMSAMTAKILISAGYKVGMYTSPFIEEFEERIQINGTNIQKDDLAKAITRVEKAVNEVLSLGYDNPTEFEIITCAMFLYFCEQGVDFAVIEVGLGGRQDSTNVMIPIACVIASISFDHMQILGDTLEKIALEKSGIIKENVPVIMYPQEQEALDVFKKVCEEKNAKLILVDRNSVQEKEIIKNSAMQEIIVKTQNDSYDISLNLLGVHQKLNCATVINLMEVLISQGIDIKKADILKGLREVKWIGRLEIMRREPMVVLDGAHNIDGITNLTNSIKKYFKYDKMVLILGILADKQVDDMIKMLTPIASKIIAVSPHSDRAKGAKELAQIIKNTNPNCEYEEDYAKAYKKALSYCDKDDLLMIAGSLYLIGDMRKVVKNNID